MPDADIVFGMLLFLAAHAGKGVSRAVFTQMFWPHSSGAAASGSLRQAIYRLKVYAPDIETTRSSIVLPEESVEFDFARLVSETPTPAEFLAYRNLRILPDYAPEFSKVFADWVEGYRDELTSRLRRGAMRALLVARMKGKYEELEGLAHVCLALDPLNEEATLVLAEATALRGNKARALRMLDEYMIEVGPRDAELRLPARVLRKRISERMPVLQRSWANELPLVGREDTVELLTRCIRDAKKGVARSAFIWGEPGIGKTRVASRALEIATLDGARTVVVRCQESDVHRPLSGITEVVEALLGLPGGLGCDPDSLATLRRLTEHQPELADEGTKSFTASDARANLRAAIFDVFDSVLEECFLLVHIDDAHLLHTSSWEILRDVWSRSGTHRLALMITMRGAPSAHSVSALQSICRDSLGGELRPLDDTSSDQLLSAVETVCGARMTPIVRRQCKDIGNGSPFFLSELARHYISDGKADGLPHTLRSLLEARLVELLESEMRVFLICAVLGESATATRIERALELSADTLIAAIAALESRGLLRGHDGIFRPAHGLIVDVARQRSSPAVLRLLHRRAGLALEEDLAARPSSALLWECATHLTQAGESERAFSVVLRLGQMLVNVGLAREAMQTYEKAKDLCTSPAQEIARLDAVWKAARASAQWRHVIEATDRLKTLAAPDGVGSTGHAEREFANLEARMQLCDNYHELRDVALAKVLDPRLPAIDRLGLGTLGVMLSDELIEEEYSNKFFRAIQTLPETSSEYAPRKLTAELIYHTTFGDLDEALRVSLELAQAVRARFQAGHELTRALRWSSRPPTFLGLFDIARERLEECLQIASQQNDQTEAAIICGWLVDLSLRSGELSNAASWRVALSARTGDLEDALQVAINDTYGLRLSLATRSVDDATTFWNRINAFPFHDLTTRTRIYYRSWKAGLALFTGAELKPAELAGMEEELRGVFGGGMMDEPALATALALATISRVNEANRFWSDYARARRERYPIPQWIADQLLDVGIATSHGAHDGGLGGRARNVRVGSLSR